MVFTDIAKIGFKLPYGIIGTPGPDDKEFVGLDKEKNQCSAVCEQTGLIVILILDNDNEILSVECDSKNEAGDCISFNGNTGLKCGVDAKNDFEGNFSLTKKQLAELVNDL